MHSLINFAELPPEAALGLLLLGVVGLVIGLSKKPKTTVALLVVGLSVWVFSENSEMIQSKFNELSTPNQRG